MFVYIDDVDKKPMKNLCILQFKLYKLYLRNDHTLLSMFQRTHGTNYSTRQRIACFFMYLSTIMMCSAIFYGVENPFLGGISESFISSLLSTLPVFAVRFMLKSAKPKIIKSENPLRKQISSENNPTKGHVMVKSRSIDATSYIDLLNIVQKQKQDTNTKEARKVIKKVLSTGNYKTRMELADEFRRIIFGSIYDLPHCFKKVAIVFLVFYTIGCVLVSIVYGISFDILYPAQFNEGIYPIRLKSQSNKFIVDDAFPSECQNMNVGRQMEEILSRNYINEINTESYSYTKRADSWGEIQDSESWIISLFTSLLLSIFIWQPITSYIMTWAKLYAFTWNLSPNTKPKTIIQLVKYVCGGCCKKRKSSKVLPKPNIDHEPSISKSNPSPLSQRTPKEALKLNTMSSIDETELETKDDNEINEPNNEEVNDDDDVQWEDQKLFTLPTSRTLRSTDRTETLPKMYNEKLKSVSNSVSTRKPKISIRNTKIAAKMKDVIKHTEGRKKRGGVVVRNERPMDILSFFSHDILFVDKKLISNETNTNNTPTNNERTNNIQTNDTPINDIQINDIPINDIPINDETKHLKTIDDELKTNIQLSQLKNEIELINFDKNDSNPSNNNDFAE